jgi:hypothetical protein
MVCRSRNHSDRGRRGGCGHSIVLEASRFAVLTIRSVTDSVDLRHVTLDIFFASVPRSISYPRIRMQSVHCGQNRVGTTSILTFTICDRA